MPRAQLTEQEIMKTFQSLGLLTQDDRDALMRRLGCCSPSNEDAVQYVTLESGSTTYEEYLLPVARSVEESRARLE